MNQHDQKTVFIDYVNTNTIVDELGDSVHVWRYMHKYTESNPGLLDQVELTRANNYVFQKDRNRFITDRVNLKKILSQYMGVDPRDVRFSYNDYGKPYLLNSGIRFNLSHSGDMSVYAVSRSEIGVDIEKTRDLPYIDEIANFYFTEEEAKLVKTLKGSQKSMSFFKIWTKKEAVTKMLGLGLSLINIDLSNYSVEQFSPHSQYVGALSSALFLPS